MISAAAIWAAETGLLSDSALRTGIRRACANRLQKVREEFERDPEAAWSRMIAALDAAPIAESTELANEQHYELPPEFFKAVLGPRRKYSGCEWAPGDDLAGAEDRALATICERGQLEDGQRILELGCGWGSLSLFMAERYPAARIVGVSNSAPQRKSILEAAKCRGLDNLEVVTADINLFAPQGRFDRIVTIEMLEHVRNYRELFARFHDWLEDDGRLFVHLFRHLKFPYFFETKGAGNWMGRHFFTGGVMPSHDLFDRVQDSLVIEESWKVDGRHYEQTANAWLDQLDARDSEVLPILSRHYDPTEAHRWLQRWRIFFMACAEMFGFEEGSQWGVSHYRFRRQVRL